MCHLQLLDMRMLDSQMVMARPPYGDDLELLLLLLLLLVALFPATSRSPKSLFVRKCECGKEKKKQGGERKGFHHHALR
jgi:hypothetical protein